MVCISPLEKVEEDMMGTVCIDTELKDFGMEEEFYKIIIVKGR